MGKFKPFTSQLISIFEGFILRAILLVIALAIIYPHGKSIWDNHATYGWGEAILMEIRIAWEVLLPALVIMLLAGYSQFRSDRRQDKLCKLMLDKLDIIDTSLGEIKDERLTKTKNETTKIE